MPPLLSIQKAKVERRLFDLRESTKDLEAFRTQFPDGEILHLTHEHGTSTAWAAYLEPHQIVGFSGDLVPGYIVPYGLLNEPRWVRVYSITHLTCDYARVTTEQFLQLIDVDERKTILARLLQRHG